MAVMIAIVATCGGIRNGGMESSGSFEARPATTGPPVGVDDPAEIPTTSPPTIPPTSVTIPASIPASIPSTVASATTRPPVPLPDDPTATVLRVSGLSGYPLPGMGYPLTEARSQPLELGAGGLLVQQAPYSVSSYHSLEVRNVAEAEVRALVAAAEDAGATDPPADLGHDPNLADGPLLVIEVDRPGLRSRLVVRDAVDTSINALGLTPIQQDRRRAVAALVARLKTAGLRRGPLQAYVRAVAIDRELLLGRASTLPSDLRTWPGPGLQAGKQGRCVVLPYADMERLVPSWSSATTDTRWRSGPEVLAIDFYDAQSPGVGCTSPPG